MKTKKDEKLEAYRSTTCSEEKLPFELRSTLCRLRCNKFECCSEPYSNDCEKLLALARVENGDMFKDIASMAAHDLYEVCNELGVPARVGQGRYYYMALLYKTNFINEDILASAFGCKNEDEKASGEEVASACEKDMVNQPDHYCHGMFEVIDEMVIVFGMEKAITFCQLNAWKYRARAPYKNNFEEDMAKANRYLEMAYELQQIRQEYPEAEGYEICALLKGRKSVGQQLVDKLSVKVEEGINGSR